jgi:predicted AlkP superfamily pyrophosphatase or phosphodiesterase
MSLKLNTDVSGRGRANNLLSPADYDGDAASIRSEQDSDSDDDERQLRARNSRELRAHDRLVLMEEEEMGQLVTESRRRQERERRGSGLPIPNPLRLFSQRRSETSRSRSRSPAYENAVDSTEDLTIEKRAMRRTRRKEKKERLLSDAQHGEDGELMYEMEEGGMKDGSSTGESSERDDSEEVDRRGLLHLADAKKKRGRTCRRWLFIHSIISVAFAILVLVAWKLSKGHHELAPAMQLVSNGTEMFAPTTLIISLDGFRADFLQRGLTPRLNAFVREGISPLYMLPSFPSVTFPNHYTLATGLYPESHGVVGNSFWDPTLMEEFYYTDPSRSLDPKWWMGEPFWATAEKHGIRTAIHMWPGSEAHILNIEPTYVDKFNPKEKLSRKVDRIFEFLDMPRGDRPQIIAAYVPNVDADGHKHGPNSTEIWETIQKADNFMDQVFTGLEQRNLTHIVNIIVVSDHGMATTDITRLIQIEDLIDMSKIEHTDGWPLWGLRPKNPDDLQELYDGLVEKSKSYPSIDVYLRDVNMPERYHFSKNDRIAPLWIVPKTGWALVKMEEMNLKEAQAKGVVYHPRGLHGYDHEHPLMRAIFIARGPAFPHAPNSRLDVFRRSNFSNCENHIVEVADCLVLLENTEVYNMLCDSIGLTPNPNNGTLRLPLMPIGLHDDPAVSTEIPADPAEATTAVPSSSAEVASTKAVLVDPLPTSNAPSSTPTLTSTSTAAGASTTQPGPQATEVPSGGGSGNKTSPGDASTGAQGFWDWLTGKVGDLWDKIAGSGKKDS